MQSQLFTSKIIVIDKNSKSFFLKKKKKKKNKKNHNNWRESESGLEPLFMLFKDSTIILKGVRAWTKVNLWFSA